jgi:glyoxylase-like metal-dependent hydrolase (beta-lactamase superfamily II)
MKLYTIDTELFKLDGGAMYGVVPKVLWNKINPADENNLCTWAMRCLLIETNNRLILVDTGIGKKQDAKFFSHYYLHGSHTLETSLSQHGFSKDDITDVFITHLHFDHCGGCIERVNNQLQPVFKNAVYWSNEEHWKWATEPNEREKASFLKENILPIRESGQLQFIPAQDNYAWLDNISIRFVHGHTAAMMLPQIQYKNNTFLYVADLFPSASHIPLPYIMAYDMFPYTTLQEKKSFLNEALQHNYIFIFEHDARYECCTLKQTEKGIAPKDFFLLKDV